MDRKDEDGSAGYCAAQVKNAAVALVAGLVIAATALFDCAPKLLVEAAFGAVALVNLIAAEAVIWHRRNFDRWPWRKNPDGEE